MTYCTACSLICRPMIGKLASTRTGLKSRNNAKLGEYLVEKFTVEGVSVGVGDEGNCGRSIRRDLDKENEQLQKELQ